MPQRIDLGRALLALGALLLLISLFLKWYDSGPNAWQVFETLDLVLAALAALALYVALRPEAVPAPMWAVPAAALVIVAVQVIDPPPAAGEADPATGAWLALGATVLMGVGAILSLAAVSVTIQFRERELRRRVPAVDRRDAAAEAAPVPAEDEPSAPPTSLFARTPPEETGRTQPFGVVPDDDDRPDRDERA
jgi:hypothetical protein